VDAEFSVLRHNIAVKSWKTRIGIQPVAQPAPPARTEGPPK